jgi:hypothetical protein
MELTLDISTEKTILALSTASTEVTNFTDYATAQVIALEKTYLNLVPDASTPKGYEQCKEVRRDLLPVKIELEGARELLKRPILDASKMIDDHLKPLILRVETLYTPHQSAYRAEDARLAQEKRQKQLDVAEGFKLIGDALVSAVGEPSTTIKTILCELQALEIDADIYEERADEANARKDAAISKLNTMLEQAEQQEQFAAKQKAFNEREAALAAKEQAAFAEKEEQQRLARQADRDEQTRKEAAKQAEQDRIAAEQRHADELKAQEARALELAEQAKINERNRIIQENNEAEQVKRNADLKAIQEDERKAKNRAHRARINSQTGIALVDLGLTKEQAKSVITAAAKGLTGALTIAY